MRNCVAIAGARVLIGSALAVGMLLFPGPSSGQVFGPVPPPKQAPNTVPLTPVEQLGKDILFDHTLSDPPGYACFTCHTPETGFTGPSRRSTHSPARTRASSPAGSASASPRPTP